MKFMKPYLRFTPLAAKDTSHKTVDHMSEETAQDFLKVDA